jgi:hypothetical protein
LSTVGRCGTSSTETASAAISLSAFEIYGYIDLSLGDKTDAQTQPFRNVDRRPYEASSGHQQNPGPQSQRITKSAFDIGQTRHSAWKPVEGQEGATEISQPIR